MLLIHITTVSRFEGTPELREIVRAVASTSEHIPNRTETERDSIIIIIGRIINIPECASHAAFNGIPIIPNMRPTIYIRYVPSRKPNSPSRFLEIVPIFPWILKDGIILHYKREEVCPTFYPSGKHIGSSMYYMALIHWWI
jgi:hypothetical protein